MYLMATTWAFCRATIRRASRGEEGNSFVEYALLLALIVIVCIVAVAFIGETTGESLSSTASQLD